MSNNPAYAHLDVIAAMESLESRFDIDEIADAVFELVDKGFIEPCKEHAEGCVSLTNKGASEGSAR